MTHPGKFRALLATLRIANAPSVVSNVWLGYVVGIILQPHHFPTIGDVPVWLKPGVPIISGLLLYFAGNLANDWFDRHWDASRRPERALPSGLFKPRTYLIAAITSALLGLIGAFLTTVAAGIAALFIVAGVITYTWIHKRTAWSVLPMGLCRAGLYVLGFASMLVPGDAAQAHLPGPILKNALLDASIVATLCSGLLAYIAGLSMSARYEGMPDPPPGPRLIARSLLVVPMIAMPCWLVPFYPAYGWIGVIPFALWLTLCLTRFRQPVPVHVSALLAGIPLVDAILLLPVGIFMQIHFDGVGASAAFVAGVPLIAFVLGRLLQKVAPAT